MENEDDPMHTKEKSKSNRKYRFKNVKYEDIKVVKHELSESEYPDLIGIKKKMSQGREMMQSKMQPNWSQIDWFLTAF